jgi:hypothetical protein
VRTWRASASSVGTRATQSLGMVAPPFATTT